MTHCLQLLVIVPADAEESDEVAKQVEAGNERVEEPHRQADEHPVLHHASDVHGERRRLADEQEHSHVEACMEQVGKFRGLNLPWIETNS